MTRKTILTGILCSFTLGFLRLETPAQTTDESLRNEVQAAINKGIRYLKTKQDPANGAFGTPDNPGFTALAAMAIMGDPLLKKGQPMPDEAKKAYDFLLSCQKPDGSIMGKGYANYTTSLSLTALTVAGHENKYRDAILKARRFIVGGQIDSGEKGKDDTPNDGGIGYGTNPASDLSNTHFALEALYHAQIYFQDDVAVKSEPQLNYAAAIEFVSKCQNLSATNKSTWVSDDEKNKGGFIYKPGESKLPKPDDLGNGKTALRSYGSMSYAGLLSFIYADLDAKDQRVKAVKEWLSKNYTVKENPGIGQEGLYYYFHTMAKAMSLAQIDFIETPGGKRANWRDELAKQMFNLQKEDGSWANENGRWMEKDSILVTSYAVLALENLIRRL
jgi:squalene-hopene/tetraprenyl-beta-curcumene cyclase